MKPASFAYHRAGDATEAASILANLGDDAKVLAGGQSLVPLLALRLARFEHLVDLNPASDLSDFTVDEAEVRIGATVRQSQVIRSAEIVTALPLLPMASRHVGHFQIRNRGTIGGSIAHADPSAEYPAVALALDASVELLSTRGPRSVRASDFFVSTFVTSIEPDELLTGIRFPVWGSRSGFGVCEAARRSGDFAIAGAVAGIQFDEGDRLSRSAIALFGVGSVPVRASTAESEIIGRDAADIGPSDLLEIGQTAVSEIDPPSDLHGSADYRRHLAAVMVARAVAQALGEVRTLTES